MITCIGHDQYLNPRRLFFFSLIDTCFDWKALRFKGESVYVCQRLTIKMIQDGTVQYFLRTLPQVNVVSFFPEFHCILNRFCSLCTHGVMLQWSGREPGLLSSTLRQWTVIFAPWCQDKMGLLMNSNMSLGWGVMFYSITEIALKQLCGHKS